jgi:uncharacterized membrane protein YqjE
MKDREVTRSATGLEVDAAASNLSTKDLITRILSEGTALVRTEIQLARTELMADAKRQAAMAGAMAAAAVLGFFAVSLLVVTLVLALDVALPAWAAALIVAVVLAVGAAIVAGVGWGKRVRAPLERTRRHIKEDVSWVKERLA